MKLGKFGSTWASAWVAALLAIAGAFSGPGAWAQAFDWPSLRTDHDKVAFLLWIRSYAPEAFDDSISFSRDWFNLLDNQEEVLKRLERNPLFHDLLKQKKGLVALEARELVRTEGRRVVDPARLPELQAALGGIDREADPARKLVETARALERTSPVKLATALIKLLPKDQRGAIFKAGSVEAQLERLRGELPAELAPAEFDAASFGIVPPAELPAAETPRWLRQAALEALERAIGARDQVKALAARVLLGDPAQAGEADLSRLQNRATAQKALAEALPQQLPTDSLVDATELGLAFLKPYLIDEPGTEAKTVLELREVPPQLALFCGPVGTDCVTQQLFAYKNSPMDRTFFIYDGQGALKGYVALVSVLYEGKPALYLININGLHMSAQTTSLVLELINASVRELGYERFLVPTEANVRAKANYEPVKRPLYEAIAGKPEVEIQFPDAKLRDRVFDRFAKPGKTDATTEENSLAVLYEPPANPGLKLPPGISQVAFDNVFTRPISESESLMFGLDIYFGGKPSQGVRIAATGGLSGADFGELVSALRNEDSLPRDLYVALVTDLLADEGLRVDASFIGRHYYLFQEGFLRCPDALETLPSRTASEFLRLVRMRSDSAPSRVLTADEAFIADHLDDFFAMKPTAQETNELRKRVDRIDLQAAIIDRAMRETVKSPADFIAVTNILVDENPTPDYVREFNRAIRRHLSRFFATEPPPTLEQAHELMTRLSDPDLVFEVLDRFAPRLRTPAELLALIHLDSGLNTEWAEEPSIEHQARMQGVARFVRRHAAEYFHGRGPSEAEELALQGHVCAALLARKPR